MKLTPSTATQLKKTIEQALDRCAGDSQSAVITDLHLQPTPASGELNIYDDDDRTLAQVTVEEWISADEDTFYSKAETLLTSLLTEMKREGKLERENMLKPYSFVLVDEEKETLADLLLIDDDTLLLSPDLLQGLDEELDNFLKELLEK